MIRRAASPTNRSLDVPTPSILTEAALKSSSLVSLFHLPIVRPFIFLMNPSRTSSHDHGPRVTVVGGVGSERSEFVAQCRVGLVGGDEVDER